MNESYWKDRCLKAENYISKSPCDPDIYEEQIKAYNDWLEVKCLGEPEIKSLSDIGAGKWNFNFVDGKLFYGEKFIANLYREVDGYYVMEMMNLSGCMSAWILIQIGQCLDVLNKKWDSEVSEDLSEL